MGVFASRHPLRRSWLVLTVIAASALVWGAVLSLPEPAPLWLLAVLVVVLAAGGPGSVVGFDFARTFNVTHRLGLAQSVVNLGGFTATLVVLQSVGWGMAAAGGYTFEAFVQRRRSREVLAAQGIRPRRIREVLRGR